MFGAKREIYEHYLNSPRDVWTKTEAGYARARGYVDTVRTRAREALGLIKLSP